MPLATLGQATRFDPDLPIIIHQSDLANWNYCPARMGYSMGLEPLTNGRWEPAPSGQAPKEKQTSALAYGTVLHHAMHVLERDRDLNVAIKTFLYYWHPLNIEELGVPPVPRDGWIARDSYGELRKRGVDTLRKYADLIRYDDHELLALEYEFVVPLGDTGMWLAGTIDRFAVRWYRQHETLCVDDYKTGQQKWNLRWNLQGTAYCYATHWSEFWSGVEVRGQRLDGRVVTYTSEGFSGQEAQMGPAVYEHRGLELDARFNTFPQMAYRRFTWINLKSFKIVDGGFRGPVDYQRLKLAAAQLVRAADERVFPLRLDGETCRYCTFRDHCGGTGQPDPRHGDPAFRHAPVVDA